MVLNLGLRYDHSRALFGEKPILDKNGDPTSQTAPGVDNLFTWNDLAQSRDHLQNQLVWQDRGESSLRPDIPRDRHRRVRQRFTIGFAALPVSRTYGSGGEPLDPVKVSDNTNLRISSSFDSPQTQSYIVGVEQELFPQVGLQVNYIHKKSNDFGAWDEVAGTYAPVQFTDNLGTEPSGNTNTRYKITSDPSSRIYQLSTDLGCSATTTGSPFR